MKEIYLAGGCFWGIEHLMKVLPGVVDTTCGYANGTRNPEADADYKTVCTGETGFRECVKVVFDEGATSLEALLYAFFRVIDPAQVNGQAHDLGSQYQAGIYWIDGADAATLEKVAKKERALCPGFAVELKALENFYAAEDYHQDYLDKNPDGYCHVPKAKIVDLASMDFDERFYEES